MRPSAWEPALLDSLKPRSFGELGKHRVSLLRRILTHRKFPKWSGFFFVARPSAVSRSTHRIAPVLTSNLASRP